MKTFYIVSSLGSDRSFQELEHRQRFETEEQAVAHAERVLLMRQQQGHKPISFYVLQGVFIVGPVQPEIVATRLEE